MPFRRPFLFRPFCFSFPNLSLLAALLLALSYTPHAAPLPVSPHSTRHVPDLWAQLLRADRFKLISSPTWVTRANQPTVSTNPNSSFPNPPFSDNTFSSSSAPNSFAHPLTLNPTVRQKTFQSTKARSKFICHVFNQPTNLNIDVVIGRVLTIASQSWVSDQDVLMKVDFRNLGEPSILANGGGTYFVRLADTFTTVLPVAAAEAIRKQDLNGNEQGDGKYDVLATVNTRTPWYDDVDAGPPPDKYDLVTVLLHEIYHNLVFAGSVTATVKGDLNANNIVQSASIHRGYLTRFDSFLKNEADCAVLGYLTDEQLSQQLNRPTDQLLADAVCNDKLYWGYARIKVAKLFAPRIFQNRSSIYHFDPRVENEADNLMFPTVRRGSAQHVVGPKILEMQRITLDASIPGANTGCARPLQNPAPGEIRQEHFDTPSDGLYDGQPLVIDNRYREEDRNRIAGLPVWAFALLIVFAILLALLLLGLCIALLLKAFRKKKYSTTSRSSSSYPHTKQDPETRTRTSSSSKTYIPGVGGSVSKSKKTRTSTSSRITTSVQPTSKHTSTSRKTSSKRTSEPRTSTERTSYKRHATCPSSGKSKYLCCCKCCRSSITPPPPIASVHTFDPDCVPTSHKHKSTRKTRAHRHLHSCHKTVKKTCKSKSSRSCSCSCYCCRYKPSSCKTSTTCCKYSCKASSSRCPPSTKPPSTKPPSTKVASSSKHCCSSKYCTSKSSSSKPCSCSKSASKIPSTKPPSTKPPEKASSSKSCRTCKASCKTCKPTGNGCACNRCEQVVEINIC